MPLKTKFCQTKLVVLQVCKLFQGCDQTYFPKYFLKILLFCNFVTLKKIILRSDKGPQLGVLLGKPKLVVSCHKNKLQNLLPEKRLF